MRIEGAPPIENSAQRFPRPPRGIRRAWRSDARTISCRMYTPSGEPPPAGCVLHRVLIERNAGPAALLRAVMHQPFLTDIQKPAARAQ